MTDPAGQQRLSLEHCVGDKLRLRSGSYAGRRAILVESSPETLLVAMETGEQVSVQASAVTNFSLAARKAWQAMPKRAGRPPASTRKKMVSFRLDADVVELLSRAKQSGRLENASDAVNRWLREGLHDLLSK